MIYRFTVIPGIGGVPDVRTEHFKGTTMNLNRTITTDTHSNCDAQSPALIRSAMVCGARLCVPLMIVTLFLLVPGLAGATGHQPTGIQPYGLIANVGQWPSHVLFLSRQAGSDVWITRSGVEIDRYTISASHQTRSGTVERQRFVDATASAGVRTTRELYRINIMRGTNPDRWISVPVYESAQISDFLPGIDVQFRSSQQGLERVLVAEPGVNLNAVRMVTDGQESVRSISVPSKNMLYESFLGGNGCDQPAGMVRMSNGEVVVAGTTEAMTYDVQLGRYSKTITGNRDGFLVRMDKDLRRVVSYTFFGGQGNDQVNDLVVGPGDEVFITGETESYDLPVSSTASSRAYSQETDAFVVGFDRELSKILFCTYHGGSGQDRPVSIALDAAGNICILGNTTSPRLPTTFPATATGAGGGMSYGNNDMFVACFSKTGFLQKGRFVGSAGDDIAASMVFDASNNLFVVGSTTTPSFAASAKGRFAGGKTDAFIMKFDQHLNIRTGESRLFGGTGDDRPVDAVIDNLGRIAVAGITTSRDFPTLGEAGPLAAGGQDVFFTIFAKDGTTIRQSGYIGGTRADSVTRIVTDPVKGNVILLGQTHSFDFYVSEGDAAAERAGETDGFIVKIDGTRVTSSLLIGGNGSDAIIDAWVDSLDRVVFLASTGSRDILDQHSSGTTSFDGSGIVIGRCLEGSISLAMPAGGETFCSGTSFPVRWSAVALPDTVRCSIEIARNGTTTWTSLATDVYGSSCLVKVPVLPAGDYVLRVSTVQGHVAQLITPFRIAELPVIVRQPMGAIVCAADSTPLSVVVKGSDVTFQWRRNGRAIIGATGTTLVVRAGEINGLEHYDCQITSACGAQIESAIAEVRLGQPPVISEQPKGRNVEPGAAFTLGVRSHGADLKYQWYRNGVALPDARMSTLMVAAASSGDVGTYFCSITSSCGTRNSDTVQVGMITTSIDERTDRVGGLGLLSIDRDNAEVRLRLVLESESPVHVRAIDISGRIVAEALYGAFEPGPHELRLSTGGLPQGRYQVVVVTNTTVRSVPLLMSR